MTYNGMKIRQIISALCLTAAVISCKKDEETTITPSLDGYLTIQNLPEFVSPGQKCTLTVKGLSHPKGKDITYYWKVLPSAPVACTTDVFTFEFTDTLQTCSIYCYASAKGYSSTSSSKDATVVKSGPKGSLLIEGLPSGNSLPGGKYFYSQIGTQTWTANNNAEGSGKGFRNASIMSDIFGKFYNYDEAVAACEALCAEWKLPSLDDWKTLEDYISATIKADPSYGKSVVAALSSNATFNGVDMWEYWPAVGEISNSTGFSAIPFGYANLKSNQFTGIYEYAAFWTSSEAENGYAHYKYFYIEDAVISTNKADKESFGASVRCIRK
jgi:uncharacterized protein (TIGR02145 family)